MNYMLISNILRVKYVFNLIASAYQSHLKSIQGFLDGETEFVIII